MTQAALDLTDIRTLEILWRCANVMNRQAELYCQGHAQEPVGLQEWYATIDEAEKELERHGIAPHPPGVTA